MWREIVYDRTVWCIHDAETKARLRPSPRTIHVTKFNSIPEHYRYCHLAL